MATQAMNQPETGPESRDGKARRKPPRAFNEALLIVIVGLVATVVGFLPTFFLRLSEVDLAHQIHGWTMTFWLVLVLVQIVLARKRHYAWHRQLGWASIALFVMMVGSSLQMMALMMSGVTRLPFEFAKFFGYSDFANMPLLFILYGGAIWYRKDRYLHSRLIATTVLTSIVPALARAYNIAIWRSMEGLHYAMHPTYLTILVVLAIAIWRDRAAGRLRWPLPFVFAWISVVYATQWVIVDVAWYDALCRALGSLAA